MVAPGLVAAEDGMQSDSGDVVSTLASLVWRGVFLRVCSAVLTEIVMWTSLGSVRRTVCSDHLGCGDVASTLARLVWRMFMWRGVCLFLCTETAMWRARGRLWYH